MIQSPLFLGSMSLCAVVFSLMIYMSVLLSFLCSLSSGNRYPNWSVANAAMHSLSRLFRVFCPGHATLREIEVASTTDIHLVPSYSCPQLDKAEVL